MSERQLSLFRQPPAPPRYPDAPGHRGVTTQVAAAKKIAPRAPSLRTKVLDHIKACGEDGATRQEIADALGMKLQTVCGRVRELVLAESVIEPGEARGGGKVVVAA